MRFSQAFGLALALLVAPLAKADTLDFTITGQGSTYTFSLPSSPLPDLSVNGVYFRLDNQPINIDDQFGETSDIRFFNTFAAGGVSFLSLVLGGPQLYTGTEAMPNFLTGQFTLTQDLATYSLTIAPQPSRVPEPATLLLVSTGAIATLRSLRRRIDHDLYS